MVPDVNAFASVPGSVLAEARFYMIVNTNNVNNFNRYSGFTTSLSQRMEGKLPVIGELGLDVACLGNIFLCWGNTHYWNNIHGIPAMWGVMPSCTHMNHNVQIGSGLVTGAGTLNSIEHYLIRMQFNLGGTITNNLLTGFAKNHSGHDLAIYFSWRNSRSILAGNRQWIIRNGESF